MKKMHNLLAISAIITPLLGAAFLTSFHNETLKTKAIGTGQLYVAGVDIVADDDHIVEGATGTVSFDADANKLTFNNFTFNDLGYMTTLANEKHEYIGIYYLADADLTIESIGENTLTVQDSNSDSLAGTYGMYSKSALASIEFIGSGSLNLKLNSSSKTYKAIGLYFKGDSNTSVTVNNTHVKILSDNADNYSHGVSFETRNSKLIINNSYFYARGGHASAESCGIYGVGQMEVNGGTFYADALEAYWVYGIRLPNLTDSSKMYRFNGGNINVLAYSSTGGKSYSMYCGSSGTTKYFISRNVEIMHLYGYNGTHDSNVKVANDIIGKAYQYSSGTGKPTIINPTDIDNPQTISDEYRAVDFEREASSYTVEPTPVTGLSYTGESQTLVESGTTNCGTVVYRFATESEYSEELPSAVASGRYNIYYKIIGNQEYKDSTESSLEVVLDKAANYKIEPTAKEKLRYTGKNIELINPGETYEGEILYKVDDGEYSEKIPMAKKAGTYTVYYKLEGGQNHYDIEERSFEVTIAKAHANNKTPGWAVALIIIAVLIVALGVAYVLMFFAFNKWIKKDGKAIRVFKLGKKDGKVRVLEMPFRIEYLDEKDIFTSK